MSARIEFTGSDFARAMAPLSGMLKSKKKIGEALIGFRDSMVRFELGGVVGKAPATGEWNGEARVAGTFLLSLAREPPSAERLSLLVENAEVKLQAHDASWSSSCQWETTARPDVFMAVNPSRQERYRLAFKHSDAELERMGLTDFAAEARSDAEKHVVRAAESLKVLGISEEELRRFVVDRLSS